jgi:hypothetical protein
MAKVFGETSTTDEVLSGVNLKGKRVLVTGVTTYGLPTAARRRPTSFLQLRSTRAIAAAGFEPPPFIREASRPN